MATQLIEVSASRIGREKQRHTSNLARGTSLARRDHDEQLHDGVVDLGAAGLNDEDVFLAHAREDADACLAVGELSKLGIGRRHAEVLTYLLGKSRAAGAREN